MKILIVEDHAMVSEGFRELLLNNDLVTAVVEAKNGLEAVSKAKQFLPDLIIMDYDLPIYNGIYGTKEILEIFPEMPILMVSVHKRKEVVMEAIRARVKGFLPKEAKAEELIEAIKALLEGKLWFKGMIAEVVAEQFFEQSIKTTRSKGTLTNRQMELIKYFAEGMQHHEIARKLSISPRTVEVHKTNIFKKLNIRNNTELIRYAIKNKLVEL